MKRSTQNNFSHLIKDELVKRFEGVVKEEIRKYNLAVDKTDCQISDLKKQILEIQNRFKVVEDENTKNCLELKSLYLEEKKKLEKNFSDTKKNHSNKRKSIEEIQEKLNFLLCSHVEKERYELFEGKTLESLKNYNDIIQKDRNNAKSDFELFKKHCELFLSDALKRFEEILFKMDDKLSKFESKLDTNIVDATGIARMIKIEQKSVFIMEKKIENIYTVLERMKKRID